MAGRSQQTAKKPAPSQPARWAPHTAYGVELLADGEWHDYREIVSKMARKVQPGVASRRAETNRRNVAVRRRYETPDVRVFQKETSELVRIGALAIARESLQNSRLFEIDPPGIRRKMDERRVRLRRTEPK